MKVSDGAHWLGMQCTLHDATVCDGVVVLVVVQTTSVLDVWSVWLG